jgi:hypothetical protein
MIFTYKSGIDVLHNHLQDIRDGKFRVLLFLLGSSFDGDFLKDIKNLTSDFDQLTGPHCLVVAFMPPPTSDPFAFWPEGNRAKEIEDWPAFVDAMTRNTYELARCLGVQQEELPSLVFIDAERPSEIAVLSLRRKGLQEVYPDLRKIFSNWYAKNKASLDQQALAASIDESSLHVFLRFESPHVGRLIDDRLREIVVPAVERGFQQLIQSDATLKPTVGKVRNLTGTLRGQPRNYRGIAEYLARHNATIVLEGNSIDAKSFPSAYEALAIKAVHGITASKPADEGSAKLSPFPLDEIRDLNRVMRLSSVAGRTAGWIKKQKSIVDVALGILKIFKVAP